MQFEAAFKRLITPHEIRDVRSSNCLPLEHIKIMNVSSSSDHYFVDVINSTYPRRGIADDTDATNSMIHITVLQSYMIPASH